MLAALQLGFSSFSIRLPIFVPQTPLKVLLSYSLSHPFPRRLNASPISHWIRLRSLTLTTFLLFWPSGSVHLNFSRSSTLFTLEIPAEKFSHFGWLDGGGGQSASLAFAWSLACSGRGAHLWCRRTIEGGEEVLPLQRVAHWYLYCKNCFGRARNEGEVTSCFCELRKPSYWIFIRQESWKWTILCKFWLYSGYSHYYIDYMR